MPTAQQREIQHRRVVLGLPKKLRKPKIWLFPINAERTYVNDLHKIVDQIEEAQDKFYTPSAINFLIRERNIFIPADAQVKIDAWEDGAERLSNRAEEETNRLVTLGLILLIADKSALAVNQMNLKQWLEVMQSAMSVMIHQREPWIPSTLNSYIKTNVSLITRMKDEHLKAVSEILQLGISGGLSQSEISKMIQTKTQVTRNRADRIARDQTGKLNGQLTQLRQTGIGISRYSWRDSRDNKVRASHRLHSNRTFRWDQPPIGTGHPGQDYNCRCWAEPVFKDIQGEIGL